MFCFSAPHCGLPSPSRVWSAGDTQQAESHDGESHDGETHDAAAGHDSHGGQDAAGTPYLLTFDFGSAVCNLAIFLGVLAILSKFVWPVILDGLKARENKIYGDLQAAEQANLEAKRLLTDYQVQVR